MGTRFNGITFAMINVVRADRLSWRNIGERTKILPEKYSKIVRARTNAFFTYDAIRNKINTTYKLLANLVTQTMGNKNAKPFDHAANMPPSCGNPIKCPWKDLLLLSLGFVGFVAAVCCLQTKYPWIRFQL
jgi:hypothetical protein